MAELAGAFADEGKSSLVAALSQRRGQQSIGPKGQEGSGASRGEAEDPALIPAHPATRSVPLSSIASADAGELIVMTNCSHVSHDD